MTIINGTLPPGLREKALDFLHYYFLTIQNIPKVVEVILLTQQHNCSGLIGGIGLSKMAKEEMDGR
jgi:hypothetical protein